MKQFFQILLLILVVGHLNLGDAEAVVINHTSAEIQPAQQSDSQSTHPLDRPSLFNIYHQVEHPGSSSNNVPPPALVVDVQDLTLIYRRALLDMDQQVQLHLLVFENTDRKDAELAFLFPFHSFL